MVANHPLTRRAHKTLWTAICNGTVKRATNCETCGVKPLFQGMIHGHHDDYSKPLDVRWLCASCHKKHHLALVRASQQVSP